MSASTSEHSITSQSLVMSRTAWVIYDIDGTAKVVYLPNVSAADRHASYTCNESFASFIALEMPRWIEHEIGEFDRLFLCGLSLSGLQAVFTALRHPGIFAGVLAQSPSAWWQDEQLAKTLVPAEANRNRFWLSVGTQELRGGVSHPPTPLFQNASQHASVHRLTEAMYRAGHDVRLHEYEGGHDPFAGALNFLRRSPGSSTHHEHAPPPLFRCH